MASVFFGAPLPLHLPDLLNFNSDGPLTPIELTKENLDWALETLALPDEQSSLYCPRQEYTAHVFNREPLVIYVENFLSQDEIAHLLDLRYGHQKSRRTT